MFNQIPHAKNLPVSLCRSTLIMRIDKDTTPKFKKTRTRRCFYDDPCVRVGLPHESSGIIEQVKMTTAEFIGVMTLYAMVFCSAGIFAWWLLFQ